MAKNKFIEELNIELKKSLGNNYKDNFDYERFGKNFMGFDLKKSQKELYSRGWQIPFTSLFFLFNTKQPASFIIKNYILSIFGERLNKVFSILADDYSKELLVKLIAFKILGYEKVKLPTNSEYYWDTLKLIRNCEIKGEKIQLDYPKINLSKFDLNKLNLPVTINLSATGILIDFFLEQYNYNNIIKAETGDIVIDAGACWGDTALYFANKVGDSGRVCSFEFIPSNIKIFNQNISLNPLLKENIDLIERPLWEHTDQAVFFQNKGPASSVSFKKFNNSEGVTKTISIDDFYTQYGLSKLDLIKMDIEGAELFALKGGVNTLKKHKPKLAIANYHGLNDFVNIPIWINDLNLGYKLYLNHFTLHWEESVIFAK